MSARLLMYLLSTPIILIINEGHCAPKLGGMLLEQLLLETFIDDGNNTNAYFKEKQAFAVPDYHDNVKNTTSLYAKLTGKSNLNPPILRTENKSNKSEEHPILFPSDFSDKDKISVDSNSSEIITTNRSSVPSVYFPSDSENFEDDKLKTQIINTHTDLHKLEIPKEIVRHAHSSFKKNREDGAILQSNGYVFNGNICQLNGYRVLCGYNGMQTATEPEPATMLNMLTNKDCILRGDRIECGYVNPSANSNRRNKKQNAKLTEPKIRSLREGTANLSLPSTIISTTITPDNSPTVNNTNITPRSEIEAANNINRESNLSKFKILRLIDRVEKNFASTVSTAPAPKTLDNLNLYKFKFLELINRVEKIIAGTVTNSTNMNFPTTTTPRIVKELPSELLEFLNRAGNILTSTNAPTNRVTETKFTISSTLTSTTTSPFTTSSYTPVYIDEGDYCLRKDGRIVCYSDTKEDYDDFLEK